MDENPDKIDEYMNAVIYNKSPEISSDLIEGDDAEFEKTCRDYYDLIVEHGPEVIAENLQQWLKETTEHGCGDDITAAFAFLKE